MYNPKISNNENLDKFAMYLKYEFKDRDKEIQKERMNNIMYVLGAIILIGIIIKGNE